MHAVVVNVTVHDREAAKRGLDAQVVPRISQARGFVVGHWVALPNGKGCSVAVFDSQDAARTVAEQLQPPGDFVTFDSVEVGEVIASA
jgi:hypothetical protein